MGQRLLHGIDMSDPDAIERLLAHHRSTFGDATMKADDEDLDEENSDEENDDSTDENDSDDDGSGDDDSDGDNTDLGDKGKKALDAMKAKMRAAQKDAKAAKAEAAQLKAEKESAGKPADEQALDKARAEATTTALAAANKRIIRSEVKAAAAGKLANPALAVRLLDLDGFEVDEDGNVDEEEIAEAIEDLLKENPYLAAQGGSVQFDSARGKPRPKGQLTKSDLAKMSPEEIAKAYDAGRIKG